MSEQLEQVAVDPAVKAEQQAQMDKQFRAMCIDFATRAKDVDSDSIIDIAKKIGAYISGE
jgi:hypothetical protein